MKLYLADTGLLCAASLGNIQFEILQNHMDVNMGGILENVFAQMFTANGFGLHYFDRKNKGEVDFVLQKGQTVIPVEIKSGKFVPISFGTGCIDECFRLEHGKSVCFLPGEYRTKREDPLSPVVYGHVSGTGKTQGKTYCRCGSERPWVLDRLRRLAPPFRT